MTPSASSRVRSTTRPTVTSSPRWASWTSPCPKWPTQWPPGDTVEPVDMSANDDELLAARDAYSRGDWRAAYDYFGRAHETAELSTDDLSSYGMAAWRLGHGRESMQLS